jgi:hypothetical protein
VTRVMAAVGFRLKSNCRNNSCGGVDGHAEGNCAEAREFDSSGNSYGAESTPTIGEMLRNSRQ